MKVRATKAGFFLGRRRPGDVFDVPEKQFSKTWMHPIAAPPAAGGKAKEPAPPDSTVEGKGKDQDPPAAGGKK